MVGAGVVLRRGVAWGAGVTVVLGAVTGALVNELHGGWPWWIACAAAVLVSAALAGWLACRDQAATSGPVTVGAGGVIAGRDISGAVRTTVRGGSGQATGPAEGVAGWALGPGAVAAGQDITGEVATEVEGRTTTPGQS